MFYPKVDTDVIQLANTGIFEWVQMVVCDGEKGHRAAVAVGLPAENDACQ